MGEGNLCQTAAGWARHTRAHTYTHVHMHGTHTLLPQSFQPPRATGADPSNAMPPGVTVPSPWGFLLFVSRQSSLSPPAAAALAPVDAGPSPVPLPATSPGAWAQAPREVALAAPQQGWLGACCSQQPFALWLGSSPQCVQGRAVDPWLPATSCKDEWPRVSGGLAVPRPACTAPASPLPWQGAKQGLKDELELAWV